MFVAAFPFPTAFVAAFPFPTAFVVFLAAFPFSSTFPGAFAFPAAFPFPTAFVGAFAFPGAFATAFAGAFAFPGRTATAARFGTGRLPFFGALLCPACRFAAALRLALPLDCVLGLAIVLAYGNADLRGPL